MAGKSDFRASNFYDPQRDAYGNTDTNRAQGKTGWDPNAKYYGGSKDASEAARVDRSIEADRAHGRAGVQADYGKSLYAAKQANYARQEQAKAMGLMRARATGQAPSIAQMQAQRDMQQAAAAQSSAAAGARGPAGLAMAQQQAASNTAAMQGNISGQAQIAAARERQAAEQAYMGAASGIRQGDMSQQGIYGQQAAMQAQLDDRQAQRNDARSMFYDQAAWDVGNRNQHAAMQEQGILAGAHSSADSNNAATNRANAGDKFGWKDAASLAGSIAGAGMGLLSDVRAKDNVRSLSNEGRAMGIPVPLAGSGNARTHSGYADDRAHGGKAIAHARPAEQLAEAPRYTSVNPKPAADPKVLTAGETAQAESAKRAASAEAHILGEHKPGPMKQALDVTPAAFAPRDTAVQYESAPYTPTQFLSDERGKSGKSSVASDPMTGALAAMKPYSYEYKEGMGEPTDDTNVGPMAQDMASNEITGSAVMPDPSTGMLAIDGEKATKLSLAGVGHLAAKVQELEGLLKAQKKGKKR